jgi:hypothetical protein
VSGFGCLTGLSGFKLSLADQGLVGHVAWGYLCVSARRFDGKQDILMENGLTTRSDGSWLLARWLTEGKSKWISARRFKRHLAGLMARSIARWEIDLGDKILTKGS